MTSLLTTKTRGGKVWHKDRFQCLVCDIQFKSYASFEQHVMMCGTLFAYKDGRYQCAFCNDFSRDKKDTTQQTSIYEMLRHQNFFETQNQRRQVTVCPIKAPEEFKKEQQKTQERERENQEKREQKRAILLKHKQDRDYIPFTGMVNTPGAQTKGMNGNWFCDLCDYAPKGVSRSRLMLHFETKHPEARKDKVILIHVCYTYHNITPLQVEEKPVTPAPISPAVAPKPIKIRIKNTKKEAENAEEDVKKKHEGEMTPEAPPQMPHEMAPEPPQQQGNCINSKCQLTYCILTGAMMRTPPNPVEGMGIDAPVLRAIGLGVEEEFRELSLADEIGMSTFVL